MAKIMREVDIKAPVEKVFDLIHDPNNLSLFWPNMVEIRNVKASNLGGFDFTWAYIMSGLRFEGRAQSIEFLTNRRMMIKCTKGIEATITWVFDSDGSEEMHLLFEMDYTIPASLLSRHPEQVILEVNGHEMDAMLKNIKTMAELELAYA